MAKFPSGGKWRDILYPLLIVIAIIALGVYFVNFGNSTLEGFSANSQDWANFGSYVSGTVGVLAAIGAFIAAICTLRQQQEQFQKQALAQQLLGFEQSFFQLFEQQKNQLQMLQTLVPALGKTRLKLAFENLTCSNDLKGFEKSYAASYVLFAIETVRFIENFSKKYGGDDFDKDHYLRLLKAVTPTTAGKLIWYYYEKTSDKLEKLDESLKVLCDPPP